MIELSQALNGMTEKERVMFWLEEGNKVDFSIALYDLGVYYNNFDSIIQELVKAEIQILFAKKQVRSNYGGVVEVEEYYLKR
jgi:hypothetical protein